MGFTGYLSGGLAIAAALAIGWGAYQGRSIDTLRETLKARNAAIVTAGDDLERAVVVNKQNLGVVEWYKAELKRRGDIAAAHDAERSKIAKRTAKNLQEIRNAPASSDGPLAPVLLEQFERMRTERTDPPRADSVATDRAADGVGGDATMSREPAGGAAVRTPPGS